MNIGEEYGSSIRKHDDAWRDTFMRVEGSVARELAAVFAEGWDRAGGPSLPGLEYVSWSDGVLIPPHNSLDALVPGGGQDYENEPAPQYDRENGEVAPDELPEHLGRPPE